VERVTINPSRRTFIFGNQQKITNFQTNLAMQSLLSVVLAVLLLNSYVSALQRPFSLFSQKTCTHRRNSLHPKILASVSGNDQRDHGSISPQFSAIGSVDPQPKSNSTVFYSVESFTSFYNKMLAQYPLPTKILSSATIGAVSDLLLQVLSNKSSPRNLLASLDLRRTLVFFTVCGLYFAPVISFWFDLLSRIPFPKEFSNTGKVISMLTIDQTIGAAAVTTGFFYAFELVSALLLLILAANLLKFNISLSPVTRWSPGSTRYFAPLCEPGFVYYRSWYLGCAAELV
jgi:hypothetical protein